jgi:hypothetical protein
MVNASEIAVFTLLLAFLLLPVWWAWRFVWLFASRRQPAAVADDALPRAAVILCLRGVDPSLVDCLAGLLRQDYPRYSVHIVVDHADDPAWNMVRAVLAAPPAGSADVHTCVLEQRRDTCGLKVSAQIQAISALDLSYEIVALIDADVIPGPGWLRSLATPLLDPKVGAATGIRWYAPADTGIGSLVRYLWNAAACTQMVAFRIPWGGSLAFHARAFRGTELLERWAHSFCEDTGSYGVLRRAGLGLRFVREATMVNRESTDLRGCCTFVRRQLVCARLHHVHWRTILLANLGINLALAATIALGVVGLATDTWTWAIGSGVLLGGYVLGLLSALITGETLVRRTLRGRGDTVPPMPLTWKLLPAAPLTQALYVGCLLSAQWLRRIGWRGITYELERPGKLRMVEYRPYAPAAKAAGSVL